MQVIKLHNTATQTTEEFTPSADNIVKIYTCGPTVYSKLHVGNWSAYIYWDVLVRTLIANGLTVDRVLNITDVGHLTSDADEGEDKLEQSAKEHDKSAWEIAKEYTDDFMQGMDYLGMIMPEHIAKATDYIDKQLELVRTLKQKGYTYQTSDGIYFDTSKFPKYAEFARLHLDNQEAGARIGVNDEKKNASDFALWKFSEPEMNRQMQWPTPSDILDNGDAKMGFPGWHLECSAIAMDILGPSLDIHTGGIDHIPVHHSNEIAQSEAATDKTFSRFWLHNNHLKVDGTKISKSLKNGYTLDDLRQRGYSANDLRVFVLQGHYSNEGNFTFENLDAAKNRVNKWLGLATLRHQVHDYTQEGEENLKKSDQQPLLDATKSILEALNNNLDTPKALNIIDENFTRLASSNIRSLDRYSIVGFLENIKDLLGIDLLSNTADISDESKKLILERLRARQNSDWARSDELRDELLKSGIKLKDGNDSTVWSYIQ